MASFTGVGDSVELELPVAGDVASVAISGTYDMTIALQREITRGSKAWQTIKRWNTANATVAYDFTTSLNAEKLRLVVLVDNSGTATATLTDNFTRTVSTWKDQNGATILELFEGGAMVPKNTPVTLTANLSITREKHAHRPLLLSAAAGLSAVAMPAATGSGDVYEFFVVTTTTSNDYVLDCSTGTSTVAGVVCGVDDAAEFTWGAEIGADNTISLGGANNATGGQIGDYIKLVDIGVGQWHASGFIHHGTGTEANPFSTV